MTLSCFDLTGKVALVSGGATGLGLGICEGLAEAGATLAICSRRLGLCEDSAHALRARTGARVLPLRCDVTRSEEVDAVVPTVCKELGGIDILVNCAGVGGSEKPLLDLSPGEWQSVLDINLTGAFGLARAAAATMVEQGRGGRIINVASISARLAIANMSAYCASKAGLVQLTKVMAREWVRYGILVNAILPGYFETPMNTEFFASEVGQRIIKSNIPMRRLGQVSEIKGLAVLMASDASSFMTGSAVELDGGHTT